MSNYYTSISFRKARFASQKMAQGRCLQPDAQKFLQVLSKSHDFSDFEPTNVGLYHTII